MGEIPRNLGGEAATTGVKPGVADPKTRDSVVRAARNLWTGHSGPPGAFDRGNPIAVCSTSADPLVGSPGPANARSVDATSTAPSRAAQRLGSRAIASPESCPADVRITTQASRSAPRFGWHAD